MPEISLFPVISQLSKTFNLLDKHFVDNVVPLIRYSVNFRGTTVLALLTLHNFFCVTCHNFSFVIYWN